MTAPRLLCPAITAILLLFACIIGLPVPLRAEDGESKLGTAITSLPCSINAPGVYSVNADLTTSVASGAAIAVYADIVTFGVERPQHLQHQHGQYR